MFDERAEIGESTKLLERAVGIESAERTERAEIDESTDKGERAVRGESA